MPDEILYYLNQVIHDTKDFSAGDSIEQNFTPSTGAKRNGIVLIMIRMEEPSFWERLFGAEGCRFKYVLKRPDGSVALELIDQLTERKTNKIIKYPLNDLDLQQNGNWIARLDVISIDEPLFHRDDKIRLEYRLFYPGTIPVLGKKIPLELINWVIGLLESEGNGLNITIDSPESSMSFLGERFKFDTPKMTIKGHTVELNDINSDNMMQLGPVVKFFGPHDDFPEYRKGFIQISTLFEEHDEEIIVSMGPDINLDNMRLTIRLGLKPWIGRLSYDVNNIYVRFTCEVDLPGWADLIFDEDEIGRQIKESVKDQLTHILKSDEVRTDISNSLSGSLGISEDMKVHSLSYENDDLDNLILVVGYVRT